MRSTPSPGVPGSNGIRRHGLDRCPRMDKREYGRRRRGSPADRGVRIIRMRYVGIDIGSDSHVVAAVTADGAVAVKPTKITEDAAGYAKLFALLGQGPVALVTIEATGHYWRNLFAALVVCGYAVALLNPLRTRRFAGEDLERTKTDSIDALGIARFGAQKRPVVTRLPDQATDELRELVRHRDRLVADFGDRVRQLHRLVGLGFPEFRRHVKCLDSMLACTLWPSTRTPRPLPVLRRDVSPSWSTTASTRSARSWPRR